MSSDPQLEAGWRIACRSFAFFSCHLQWMQLYLPLCRGFSRPRGLERPTELSGDLRSAAAARSDGRPAAT